MRTGIIKNSDRGMRPQPPVAAAPGAKVKGKTMSEDEAQRQRTAISRERREELDFLARMCPVLAPALARVGVECMHLPERAYREALRLATVMPAPAVEPKPQRIRRC